MFSRFFRLRSSQFSSRTAERKNPHQKRKCTTQPGEIPPPLSYNLVRDVLQKRTKTTNIFTLLTVAATVGTLYYYVYDWHDTPNALLERAKNMLANKDPAVQKEGMDLLNKGVVIKRVFSGPVGIPIDPKLLARDDIIELMVERLSSEEEVRLNALIYLYKLLSYKPLRNETKELILKHDPKLEKLVSVVSDSDKYHTESWNVAAHILTKFKNTDGIDKKKLVKGISSLTASSNPLALATAAHLAPLVEDALPEDLRKTLQKVNTSHLVGEIFKLGMDSVPEYDEHKTLPQPTGPAANLFNILGISMLSGIWGYFMWKGASKFSSGYKGLKRDYPKEEVKQLRQQFLQNKAVGRGVFALLLFDYLASLGLQYTSGDSLTFNSYSNIKTPSDWKDTSIPMSSAYPMVQTSLFALGLLILIQRQRFVFLPMLLAGAHYNRDLLNRFEVTRPASEFLESGVKEVENKAEDLLQSARQITSDGIGKVLPTKDD